MENRELLDIYNRTNIVVCPDDQWQIATWTLHAYHILMDEWKEPILEVGGGDGILSFIVGRHIDLMIDIVDIIIVKTGIHEQFLQCSIEKTVLPSNSFNTIVMFSTISHVNFHETMDECYRLLNPGGRLIITDHPNYVEMLTWPYLFRQAGRMLDAERWEKYELRWHQTHINKESMYHECR